jgi:hypothetical protein
MAHTAHHKGEGPVSGKTGQTLQVVGYNGRSNSIDSGTPSKGGQQ